MFKAKHPHTKEQDMEQRPVAFRDNETWWLGTDGAAKVYVEYLCEDYSTDDEVKMLVSARIKIPQQLRDKYNGDKRVDDCGDVRWLELRVENEGTIRENVIQFTFYAVYEKVKEEVALMASMI
jgi:hypothetical protein